MKIRTVRNFALTLSTAAVLSACGLFSNDSRYEPVELTQYTQTVSPSVVWSASIGSGSAPGFAPVWTGESVFAATPDGNVVRVNAATGRVVWSTRVKAKLSGGVGVNEGVVAVTTRDAQLVVLNADSGQEIWSSAVSTISSTPPAIAGGVVVVRSDDFRVQGFNLSDGSLLWSYVRTVPEMSLQANSRMVFADVNTVLAAVPTGRLAAINTRNGRPYWDVVAANVKGVTDVDGVTDVVGMPLVVGNEFCVASYQGNVACYALTNQGPAMKWAQPFSSAVGIDATASTVAGAAIDGTVSLFNRQNGQVIWSDRTLANRGLSNPVVFNNHVIVADYEGYAHFYDFNSGTLQGRGSIGSGPIVSPLIATPSGVIAQTGNGKLVLFGAK